MPEIPGDDRSAVVPDMKAIPRTAPKISQVGTCSINPVSGNETVIEEMAAPKGARRVLVVGGGPGGMQAAITAADRGHAVTLVEKSGSLGGTLRFTDTDVHKTDLKNFKDLLVREVGRRKIKVMLNTEATPEFIRKFKPEALILAIGASPTIPPIPGIETAVNVLDIYRKGCRVARKVVMVGGGLSGCETAIHLAAKGHEVTIVEMLDRLAPEAGGMKRAALMHQIETRGNIAVMTGAKCIAITPPGVKVQDASGKEATVNGDTVVYSLGMTAKRDEVERLRAAGGKAAVFEIGDCVRGANVFEAVSEGFMAAMKIV